MPCVQKDMIGRLVTEANSYGPDGSVAAELILKMGENVEQRLACLCRMYREGRQILVPHVVEMSRTKAYRLNSNHVLRQGDLCRLLINGHFYHVTHLDKGPIQPGAEVLDTCIRITGQYAVVIVAVHRGTAWAAFMGAGKASECRNGAGVLIQKIAGGIGHKLTEEQARAFFPRIKGKGKPPYAR